MQPVTRQGCAAVVGAVKNWVCRLECDISLKHHLPLLCLDEDQ